MKDTGKIGTPREPADEQVRLAQSAQYPYHHRMPASTAERAALGVLAELLNRRVIGETLGVIDNVTRNDIVHKLALIINLAYQE